MAVRIQTTSAACIACVALQHDHMPMWYVWCALQGEQLPYSGGAQSVGGLSRESFPSLKRMEGPHIFRKWCLPVGIHQDFGLLSAPAASQLYNPEAQTGSFSQCFPRGFWQDSNLTNIMVKGLNPNSLHHIIPVGNRCSRVVFVVTKENECTF